MPWRPAASGPWAEHALAKPGAWADQPWEGDHVAKVGEKIFASSGDGVGRGQVRPPARRPTSGCAEYPDDASVMAYIGRYGWNTLRVGGAIPDDELREAVDASYDLVVATLPKSRRP